MRVRGEGGSYTDEYRAALQRLYGLKIRKIYSGHDEPVLDGGLEVLVRTLEVVLRSETA